MMGLHRSQRRAWRLLATTAALVIGLLLSVLPGAAQQRGRGQQPAVPAGAPGPTLRSLAPLDLTGWWVSVVTEDWRWRMITAPKGDYRAIPYNAEGRRIAEAWDLAKDNATGNQCKAYGAAGIMRIPTRLHITWEGETTLKIETDAGRQIRLGLRANLAQFSLLVAVNALVGGTLGQERTVVPLPRPRSIPSRTSSRAFSAAARFRASSSANCCT